MTSAKLSSHWPAFLITGVLALLAGSLSGCRFGNHVDRRASSVDSGRVLGYFSTTPQKYEVCAKLDDGSEAGDTSCREVYDYSLIPFDLYMTDPALIVIDDPKTATMTLRRKDDLENSYIVAKLAEDTQFTLSGNSNYDYILGMKSFACFNQFTRTGTGSFTPTDGMSPSADQLPLAGTLAFNAVMEETLAEDTDGDCVALLQKFKACYSDYQQCPYNSVANKDVEQMSLHLSVIGYFKDLIDAGAMTEADIDRYRGVIYRVISQ